jgi:hypothetical protein
MIVNSPFLFPSRASVDARTNIAVFVLNTASKPAHDNASAKKLERLWARAKRAASILRFARGKDAN